jgi:hypothetical protein
MVQYTYVGVSYRTDILTRSHQLGRNGAGAILAAFSCATLVKKNHVSVHG